ncbi:response regulator [Flexivirga meconopsidis]|uniref:response regulator n=1 Tax=Flexivirga meconopsidis TaxID=2977121 RepID=UPI00223EF72A|nr:response regulator transcription factor [Flexivirga meconopsidis]
MTHDRAARDTPAARSLRVLLVEDYAIYRRGLQTVLELEDGIELVGDVGTATEAVERTVALAPDVLVLDIYLPDGNGLEVCRAVKAAVPQTQILMLTASDEEADLVEAIKAGATGYLLKDVAPEQLPGAIRAVAAGQALLSPSLASTLLSEFAAMVRSTPQASTDPVPALTEREREVLRHVARGWSNRRVAEELFISENTVKNHVRNILDKLHLRSRVEAAMYAVRGGLIEDPDTGKRSTD